MIICMDASLQDRFSVRKIVFTYERVNELSFIHMLSKQLH